MIMRRWLVGRVKPMVFSLVVLCLNPFTLPTQVFGRVSCLLKIVGFSKLSIPNPEDTRDYNFVICFFFSFVVFN